MIKAIPTRYAGCEFRSRLEARWAVFFDHLRIRWEYEPQGFFVGPDRDSRKYLPDFYLPEHDVWAEVKGDPTHSDMRTLYYAAHPDFGLPVHSGGQRMLLLGNIPHVAAGWLCWQHSLTYCPGQISDGPYGVPLHTPPGVYTRSFRFVDGGIDDSLEEYGIHVAPTHAGWGASYHSIWHFDAYVDGSELSGLGLDIGLDPATVEAYKMARSARFEFGQSGGRP